MFNKLILAHDMTNTERVRRIIETVEKIQFDGLKKVFISTNKCLISVFHDELLRICGTVNPSYHILGEFREWKWDIGLHEQLENSILVIDDYDNTIDYYALRSITCGTNTTFKPLMKPAVKNLKLIIVSPSYKNTYDTHNKPNIYKYKFPYLVLLMNSLRSCNGEQQISLHDMWEEKSCSSGRYNSISPHFKDDYEELFRKMAHNYIIIWKDTTQTPDINDKPTFPHPTRFGEDMKKLAYKGRMKSREKYHTDELERMLLTYAQTA